MSSIKCFSCGLVNFASDEVCKKCGSDLKAQKSGKQKLSTACPRCDSENTQSFQMAYQTGTSKLLMIGISEGGGLGLGGGKNQSALAKSVKPPEPPSSVGESIALIILLVVGFNILGAALMLLIDPFIGIFVAVALTIAVAIFGAIKSRSGKDKGQRQFHLATDRWRRSWICLKCGGTWLVHQ
jgi:hypothetical protein